MRTLAIVLLVLAWPVSGQTASPLAEMDAAKRPRLKSIYSTVHDLEEFTKGDTQGIVLVFLGTNCPVARSYIPRLIELAGTYRGQHIKTLGIYSDVGVNAFDMATHAQDLDISFPVFKDVDHRLATWLGVQATPEVVVLDKNLAKVYQGAIDDQFKRHGRKPAPTENYLQSALASLVSGQPVKQSYVPASGCPLELKEPGRAPRDLTYYRDVLPVLQRRCQGCHRDGGPAPFELTTFDDVAHNTEKIREVVLDRRMPPWHGVLNPQYGKFANDQRLTAPELDTLVSWINGGASEGKQADAPPQVKWPGPTDWTIGKPDYVYKMTEPFRVPKSGTLEYQFFRVNLDQDQDRWFRGVEIRPGHREVVHHITLHIAPSLKDQKFAGFATMALLYGINAERANLIHDYVPGDTYNVKRYPPDQAVLIPKHSDLIFEVHYTPNNREAVSDQSMVAFQWASGPPQDEILTKVFRKPAGRFRIPPHDSHRRMEDAYYFEKDVVIEAIRPHFHLRGKSYRLERIERDPETDEVVQRQTILSVPVFDPAWQRTYELATPFVLPAGTELLATAIFDNSSLNPNNPDPSQELVWGQQITDEMFSTRFKYRMPDKHAQGEP